MTSLAADTTLAVSHFPVATGAGAFFLSSLRDKTSLAVRGTGVLEQLVKQVPAAGGESGVELVVGERPGLLAGEEADERAVVRVRAAEGAR